MGKRKAKKERWNHIRIQATSSKKQEEKYLKFCISKLRNTEGGFLLNSSKKPTEHSWKTFDKCKASFQKLVYFHVVYTIKMVICYYLEEKGNRRNVCCLGGAQGLLLPIQNEFRKYC